jgi:phosphate transport system substrate-binding protein
VKLQRSGRASVLALSAVAVVSSLTLAACGSDDNSSDSKGSSTPSSSSAAASTSNIKCGTDGQLLGAGSTAQKNAMDQWVKDYQAACSGTTINYQANGSGAGIQNFVQGKAAFAGSDAALKPDEVTQSKKVCTGGQGIDLPMVAGPIAIGYNLQGVDNLVLNADTIAKIFDSQIKKWNDPAIGKLNPGVKLPATPIQPFHRSDDSGTTQNLAQYLSATAKSSWKYTADKKWHAKGGQSAEGSAGVASQVKQVNGAIGYFEISYATADQINTAKLDTGASSPVEVSSEAASTAVGQAQVIGKGNDLALQFNYATKADGAWPITLVTYEIACDKGNDPKSLKSVQAFLNYTASVDGQKSIVDKGYAPIPDSIISKVREIVPTLS